DVWSVGAVMFYMLTGRGPFEMDERSDTLRFLLSGTPTLPLPADVHPAIARIIDGCLARRPRDRFQSAEALGSAIEMTIDEIGISASATDVAEFMKECSRARIAGDNRSAQGVADPFALSFTRDDEPTRSLTRPRVAQRAITWIAMGALCVAPASMYLVRQARMPDAP